jgi:hypothetical protein
MFSTSAAAKESPMDAGDVTIIRYTTKPESADENQRLIEAVFDQLRSSGLTGLRYQAFRQPDGVSFVHIVQGDTSGLSALSAFVAFQEDIGSRVVAPPTRDKSTSVAVYP